jgi:hypothetical protein
MKFFIYEKLYNLLFFINFINRVIFNIKKIILSTVLFHLIILN